MVTAVGALSFSFSVLSSAHKRSEALQHHKQQHKKRKGKQLNNESNFQKLKHVTTGMDFLKTQDKTSCNQQSKSSTRAVKEIFILSNVIQDLRFIFSPDMHNCWFWNQFLLKNNFNKVNKKIQSPHSSTQQRMHVHKHTVDLNTDCLRDSPALCACGGPRGNLCSSACAGEQAFLKPSCRGNCWC